MWAVLSEEGAKRGIKKRDEGYAEDAEAEPDVRCNGDRVYRKNAEKLSRGKDPKLHEEKCCKAPPRATAASEPDEDDSEPEEIESSSIDVEVVEDEQQIDVEDPLEEEPEDLPDTEENE